MQIVITIDDKTYEDYKYGLSIKHLGNKVCDALIDAMENGVVLPKGHGRLIDADDFIKTMEDASERQKYKKLLIDDLLTVDDVFKAVIESLQNKGLAEGDAPTIIDADKESGANV